MRNYEISDLILKWLRKYGIAIVLSLTIGYTLIIASISRFWDSEFLSGAAITGLAISGLLPCIIFLVIGPIIISKPKILQIIHLITILFALISIYYTIFDYLSYTEWNGYPTMANFGYYWTYSFYPPVILIAAMFSLMIVSFLEKIAVKKYIENSDEPNKNLNNGNNGNYIFVFSLIVILTSWLMIDQYFYNGFYSFLLILCGIVSFIFLIKILSVYHVFWGRDRNKIKRTQNNSVKISEKDFRNGMFNVLKSLGGWIPFFALIFANTGVLTTFILRPNYIPMFLEFFPMLLISGLLIGILYKISRSRYLITIFSALSTLIAGIFIISDQTAFVLYRDLILWLIAISIMGSFGGFSLYLESMTKGVFSKVFWGIMGIFLCLGGYLVGTTLKWDLYDETIYYGTAPVALLCFVILFIGRLIAKTSNRQAATKTEAGSQAVLENRKKKLSNTLKKGERVIDSVGWQKIALLGVILGGLLIVPTISMSIESRIETEHVLASSNGDYYIWSAENTRTIDKYYTPSLRQSTINSTYRLSAARGEHQGFQMIFSPGKIKTHNLRSIEVLSDLQKQDTGAKIGKDNISIYAITYVEQLHEQFPDHFQTFSRIDTGLSLRGQKNYPFYVDVSIPRDDKIEPGIYNTTIQVYCRDYHKPFPEEPHQYNNRIVTFDLEVKVYNFTISLERHINMEIIWGIPDNAEWKNFYGNYRLDPYWPSAPVSNYNYTSSYLDITFNFTRWFDDLEEGFNNGMSYFPITWNPPGLDWESGAKTYSSDYETLVTWYINNITNQLAGKKTPWGTDYLEHAYFFIRDEPQPKHYDLVTAVAELIHSLNSSVMIMETMNQELSTYPNDFLEEIDHYCMHINEWYPSKSYPDDEEVNKWPSRLQDFLDSYSGPREKTLWIYHTHNGFPTPDTDIMMSGMLQRSMLWLHWIYNVDTYLYWSFNWGTDIGEGYGYASYGESNLVGYGENDEPLSSLRLERIRDGIEDYEYFWILNDTCTELENKGYGSEASSGRSLLEDVSEMFNQPEYWDHLPNYNSDIFEGFKWSYSPYADHYISLRNLIGEELSRINSLGIL